MILHANSFLIVGLLSLVTLHPVEAQENSTKVQRDTIRTASGSTRADDTPKSVLSPDEWRNMDSAVQRGLTYIAAQQQADGSFPTDSVAQPGVTSLCVLAFMAHGHNPGNGPYGERLDKAIRYIVDCQKPSGLIMLLGSEDPQIDREVGHDIGSSGTYDHAISSLTLSELYGMNPSKSAPQLKSVIEKSLAVTMQMQHWIKHLPQDK